MTAYEFIKAKDAQLGEGWSEDNTSLATTLDEYAKLQNATQTLPEGLQAFDLLYEYGSWKCPECFCLTAPKLLTIEARPTGGLVCSWLWPCKHVAILKVVRQVGLPVRLVPKEAS